MGSIRRALRRSTLAVRPRIPKPRVVTCKMNWKSIARPMAPQKIMLFAYVVTVVCAVFGVLLSFLF